MEQIEALRQATAKWTAQVAAYQHGIEDESPLESGAEPGAFEYRMIKGDGDSEAEAIEDWVKNLPVGKWHTILWRVPPELVSEVNSGTRKRMFRVWSRFALIPFADKAGAN